MYKRSNAILLFLLLIFRNTFVLNIRLNNYSPVLRNKKSDKYIKIFINFYDAKGIIHNWKDS